MKERQRAVGDGKGKGHRARGEEVCLVYLVCFVHRTKETTQTRETNVKLSYY